jgi:hypothetical protein
LQVAGLKRQKVKIKDKSKKTKVKRQK